MWVCTRYTLTLVHMAHYLKMEVTEGLSAFLPSVSAQIRSFKAKAVIFMKSSEGAEVYIF